MEKKIFTLIIILVLTACSYNTNDKIIINKIGINKDISISSINEDVTGIVMFSEYGRPDILNSNTIIGAHSGIGKEALFNDLELLDIGDTLELIYNSNSYTYLVIEKLIIDEYDLSILEYRDYSILTLMTCKIGDSTKRVVVICKLDI